MFALFGETGLVAGEITTYGVKLLVELARKGGRNG